MRCLLPALLAFAALGGIAPSASAWTDKPVRLVVPAPPGGTMDVVARLLAEQLAADLKQPVVVDNKPGAGGAIAAQSLLSAPADGQSIMVTASNVLTEIPHVMKTAFDPLKDVKPVATLARAGMVLVGPANGPADFASLVAHLKANPGKLAFASYTAGTSSHYAGMILNQKAGLDLQHVPFAGSPAALTQVMAGQIAVMFDGIVTSLPLVKAGKLKAYAVAGKVRSPYLPEVPTTAELGYPDLDFSNWLGVVVPSAVPSDTVDKIALAIQRAGQAPKLRERLMAVGFDVGASLSPSDLAQSVRVEFERNARIVKAFDIRLAQ